MKGTKTISENRIKCDTMSIPLLWNFMGQNRRGKLY